jgi:stage II sporulation protein M
MTDTAQALGQYTSIPLYTGGFRFFLWQNSRVLLAAALISMFTFGVGALVITPVVYFILGYLFSQIMLAGYNPSFLFAAVLTHGVIEIPVIVLATAVAVRLGAIITRPPQGMTVGHAWLMTVGDTLRLTAGVIFPGLVLAAFIEAYVTPLVVLGILRG